MVVGIIRKRLRGVALCTLNDGNALLLVYSYAYGSHATYRTLEYFRELTLRPKPNLTYRPGPPRDLHLYVLSEKGKEGALVIDFLLS